MSPTGLEHGGYESNFDEHLRIYARRHKSGRVFVGEVGIYTHRNPDTVRAVDVIYISHQRLAQRKRKRGYLDVAPELVVEILSPDDSWSEVTQKLREHFAIGVLLVWVYLLNNLGVTVQPPLAAESIRRLRRGETR